MIDYLKAKNLLLIFLTTLLVACTSTGEKALSEQLSLQNSLPISAFGHFLKHTQNNIYFDTASSVVKQSEYRILEVIGAELLADDQLVVEISGHTDERGDLDFNKQLSRRRAQATAKILYTKFEIDPTRMAIVSYGDSFPAVSGSSEASWALNRRVQLDVYTQGQSKSGRKQFKDNQLNEDNLDSFKQNSEDLPSSTSSANESQNQSKKSQHFSKQIKPDLPKPDTQRPPDTSYLNKPKLSMEIPPILESTPCGDQNECDEKGLGVVTGTGFFITDDGNLITNYHVIADSKGLFVMIDGEMISAGVEAYSIENDLAMLSIKRPSTPIPFTTLDPKKGSEVAVLGYPNISVQGNELKVTVGHINSLSGSQNDTNMMQFDAAIQPGNSGGPLINSNGLVIGVATATLKQEAAIATSGTLAQNVNYAVKMRLASFLDGFINIKSAPSVNLVLTPVQLVDAYEDSVVLIINYYDEKSSIQEERKKRSEPALDSVSPSYSTSNETSGIQADLDLPSVQVDLDLPSFQTDLDPPSMDEIQIQKYSTQPFRPQYIYKARPQP